MPSFVQGGEKDMWVGLLDQEFMMQTSHALVQAFKKGSFHHREKRVEAHLLLQQQELLQLLYQH